MKLLAKLFDCLNYLLHNSYIPSTCMIGVGSKFAYGGIGMVIHARTAIERHCMIWQGVTIGGKSESKGAPVIEDNVFIGAGGVVVRDVTPFSVVAGVSAKIVDRITYETFKSKYQYYYRPLNYRE